MPKFDKTGYKPRSGFTVPEGKYLFEVNDAVEIMSSNENDMIVLELLVEIEGREKPLRVKDRLVFCDTALFRIDQFTKATGTREAWDNDELEGDDCIGLTGWCYLQEKPEYMGKTYMEVGYYIEEEGFSEQPSTSGATDSGARARKAKIEAAQGNQAAAGGGPPDDSIPF